MSRTIILLLCVTLTSCATITRGTSEVLVIETEPSGASVTLNPGEIKCISPCSLSLKRKGNYMVQIEKEGYEPVQTQVLSQVAGAGAAGMAGNVLLGGLIGAGVDAASGATKELKPNPLKVTLIPRTVAN